MIPCISLLLSRYCSHFVANHVNVLPSIRKFPNSNTETKPKGDEKNVALGRQIAARNEPRLSEVATCPFHRSELLEAARGNHAEPASRVLQLSYIIDPKIALKRVFVSKSRMARNTLLKSDSLARTFLAALDRVDWIFWIK